MEEKNQLTILIIFGISGNLSQKKVIPALYSLYKHGLLPNRIKIIGLSRRNIGLQDIFSSINLTDNPQDSIDQNFLNLFKIKQFDSSNINQYHELRQSIEKDLENEIQAINLIFYLSIPPDIFSSIIDLLGQSQLNSYDNKIKTRLLIEKPFGYDLNSAKNLINLTNRYFSDQQIFRIDHYLAKETVQNILIFRRFNPLFQTAWNNQHIQSININTFESVDIEGRVDFYEKTGALRDQIQNHLFQLLTATTMTLPTDLTNTYSIHQARHSLLANIMPMKDDNMILKNSFRAQYDGYKDEVNNQHSTIETFASIKLEIQNSLWKGIPIKLTTGKALSEKKSEIIINFSAVNEKSTNQLNFRLQPNEGIDICLSVKKPGFDQIQETATMDFSYKTAFQDHYQADPYEKVIIDCLKGDNTLFATSNEIIDSWKIIQPILDFWQSRSDDLQYYPKGTNQPILKCL